MTDTDRLAELAAAATPGPWKVHPVYSSDSTDDVLWHEVWPENDPGKMIPATVEDAAFIAACDPATIRSLVDDNRELRAALDETQRMLEYLWSATGSRAPDMPVHDLFNEDDPITDDILTILGRARMLVHGATPAPRAALHREDGT